MKINKKFCLSTFAKSRETIQVLKDGHLSLGISWEKIVCHMSIMRIFQGDRSIPWGFNSINMAGSSKMTEILLLSTCLWCIQYTFKKGWFKDSYCLSPQHLKLLVALMFWHRSWQLRHYMHSARVYLLMNYLEICGKEMYCQKPFLHSLKDILPSKPWVC